MKTKTTQKYIAIQVPVEDVKNIRGRKTGRVKCRLFGDGYEIFADSRQGLAEQLDAFARRAAQSTSLAVVRLNGESRYIVQDAHGTHTSRDHDDDAPDGRVMLHSLRSSQDDILEAATDTLYDLCQQHWATTGEIPDCLPESKRTEFDEWVAWQERYREAIVAGKESHEAHAIACGMEHLIEA